MEKKNRGIPRINMGGASLLVVFLILCLSVFAALTLSTAKRERNAVRELAERRQAYFEASNRSEYLISWIDGILQEEYSQSGDGWMQSAGHRIEEEGNALDSVEIFVDVSGEVPEISWQYAMDSRQNLLVELLLQEPEAEGQLYRIKTWKTAQRETWEGDDTLTLILQ